MDHEKRMEFNKSIIKGVEIKLCKNDPHAYKHHVHSELSLGYITEGSTDLTLNDETIHYKSGDGVIIPPLTTHRCAPLDVDHWAYVMLFIDPGYYSDFVCFQRAKKLSGCQALKLRNFIDQLLQERNPDALENILVEILLEFGEKSEAKTADNCGDIAETVHEYILNHVNNDVTLSELQRISGTNKFTIIRSFKKQYVATPASYHLQCRVAEAKRMLSQGVNVFEVCGKLNFYDQAHLIREFKKMYGITPGTYMEQLKK